MSPPVMIMDELDTGVGARLGKAVGHLLRGLSAQPSARNSPGQILCVSHLPQVCLPWQGCPLVPMLCSMR